MSGSDNDKPHHEPPEAKQTGAEQSAGGDEPKPETRPEAAAEAGAHKKELADKAAWEKDPQAPEWSEGDKDPLVEALRASHGEAVLSARTLAGDLVVEVRREEIRGVCRSLKDEHGYALFVDLCGAHFPQREENPLEVIYVLYSLDRNSRVRLKVRTSDGVDVPSVTPVYAGANWAEREVYDMYGIRFAEHPDMTRILMWEGFNGHPLRKEFPLEGVDTGAAIYPEYYGDTAGPVAGTGTGWKPPEPPAEPEGDATGESEQE